MVTTRTPTTPLSPGRRGLPPPLALDLTVMDRKVGWIRDDVIGFRGFHGEVEATHAAWVAHRGLERRLAKGEGRGPTPTLPVDTVRLALAHRGGAEVVLASGRRIATLLRPGLDDPGGDESFGFELRVPGPKYEARMRAMANVVYRELRRSGTRWAIWARDGSRPEAEGAERAMEPTPLAASVRAPGGWSSGFGWGRAFVTALLEVPRRWWERRARRRGDEATTMPDAAERGDTHRTSAPRWAPIATVASLVVLLVAFNVPERTALILSALGLTGLFAIRLFGMPAGWPRRPVRPRSLPTHVAAGGADDVAHDPPGPQPASATRASAPRYEPETVVA